MGSIPTVSTNLQYQFFMVDKKKVLIIGDFDNTMVAAIAKALQGQFPVAHPAKDCSCECHKGTPGRWHCFSVCCDEPDVIVQRGCF